MLPVIENRIDGEKIQVASLEHHLRVIQSPNEVWFGDFFCFGLFDSRRFVVL